MPFPVAKPGFFNRRLSLAVFLVLFALVITGVSYSLFIYYRLRNEVETEAIAADRAQAEMGAQFIANHQTSLMTCIKVTASGESFLQAVRRNDLPILRGFLESLISRTPELTGAVVLNRLGRVIAKAPPAAGRRMSGRRSADWFLKTSREGRPTVSVVSTRAGRSRPDGIVISVPVTGPTGNVLAVLAGYQSLDLLADYFSRLTARHGREYLIVDDSGRLVVGSKTTCRAFDLSGLGKDRSPGGSTDGPQTKMVQGEAGGRLLVSAAAIPRLNWRIIISHDHDAVMTPMRAMMRNLTLFFGLLFICLVGLALLILEANKIQKKALRETAEAARRLEVQVRERTADLSTTTQRYRSLLSEIPDVVYELDGDGLLTFVSNASFQLLGYRPEEMIGHTWQELVYEEDQPAYKEQKFLAADGGVLSIGALRHITRQGDLKWISINCRGLFDERGALIGRIGIARDVSGEIEGRDRIRQLSRRLIQTQEDERKRLALDLHDEMGQLLSALKIGLQTLVQDDQPFLEKKEAVGRLVSLSQDIMNQVRSLAYSLRPAVLDRFGLVPAIEDLAETVAETAEVEIRYTPTEVPDSRLSSEVKTTFFRFIQEALTNAVRHSGSPVVEVSLEYGAKHLIARVRDYGRGFDVDEVLSGMPTQHRLGLVGMKERMRLIGGDLDIRSDDGGSTLTAATRVSEEQP